MADTSISRLFFDDAGSDTTVLEFPNRVDGMLADLLAAASGPGTASELSGEAQARAMFTSTAAAWSKPRRRIRPARMAVVAVSAASLLATTTTVLAAASVLPSPAANIVDKALRHVDINISPPVPSQIGGLAPTTPGGSDDVAPASPTPSLPTSASVNAAQAPPAQPASAEPAPSTQNPNLAEYSQAVAAAAAAATRHGITVSGATGTQTGGSSSDGGVTYMGGNQGSSGGTGGGSTTGGQTIPVQQGGTPPTTTTGTTPPTTTGTTTTTAPPTVTKGTPPSVVNQTPSTGNEGVTPTAGGIKGSGTVEQEGNGSGTQNSTSGGPSGTNKDETTANQ
jgi:hypothetical protein